MWVGQHNANGGITDGNGGGALNNMSLYSDTSGALQWHFSRKRSVPPRQSIHAYGKVTDPTSPRPLT